MIINVGSAVTGSHLIRKLTKIIILCVWEREKQIETETREKERQRERHKDSERQDRAVFKITRRDK